MAQSGDPNKLVVIGAGPGGYPAAFLAADLGLDVTLVDLEAQPGGVCLYRGCIPSKTLLHLAKLINETQECAEWGVRFSAPEIDLEHLRNWKNEVIGKLTGGLASLGRSRKVKYVQGRAAFTGPNALQVALVDGGEQTVEFDAAIVATGSEPIALPRIFPESDRVLDSTGALELDTIPETMLVVGGGYIGLEMATVYTALGTKVTVAEANQNLLPGADRDLVDVLEDSLRKRVHAVLLNTRAIEAKEVAGGIEVKLVGLDLAEPEQTFEKVLVAVGRRPATAGLGLEHTAAEVDDHGFIKTDRQRRTAEPSIFAIGDVAGQPMLAHKASYESRVAVEAIAGLASAYDPQAIPAVVFTDPELAWCGLTETEALANGIEVKITRFPWAASGRATTLGRPGGLTKLILDPIDERVLGMGVVGYGAGELISEGVLAVEMAAQATDLEMTIHPHPTLSETVMEAADLYRGASPHYKPRS